LPLFAALLKTALVFVSSSSVLDAEGMMKDTKKFKKQMKKRRV